MKMKNKVDEDKKKAIKNHANRNIAHILKKLDIEFYDRGDGLIQSSCPCLQHGGDRSNQVAWSWRIDLGKWVCWSHHCEEIRGNDIFGLVSSILNLNFKETVDWITETLKQENVDLSQSVPDPENLHRGTTLHIHEPLPEDNIKFLQPDPQYLLNRGFDIQVLRKYQAGLWSRPGTYMDGRVVFPVRDHDNHLVGYTARTVHSPEYFEKRDLRYSKWVHGRHYNRWPQRGDIFTSSILFNLNNAKNHLGTEKKMILVEGPLDGMRLEEAGIHNWVATLGTSFCNAHRTLLVKYGVKHLYVAYDNDDPEKYIDKQNPGERGWERLKRIVGDLFELKRVELPSGTDCGDLDVDTIKKIFKDLLCSN